MNTKCLKKEQELVKREQKLRRDEESLSVLHSIDNNLRFEQLKRKYDQELDNIKEDIKKKINENRRLSETYKICKDSNETLKQQVEIKAM